MMQLTREDTNSIPSQYLETVAHYLMSLRNDTVDFSKPHLRDSVRTIYPLFLFMYAILVVGGTLANLAMVFHIVRRRLHKDPSFAFLINIAICHFIDCIFVLPITLAVLLLQNWVFGKFLCFFLPMLQDIPNHVCMMTYLLIAADRYRLVNDPGRPRIPAFVCALGTWFFAVCIVLPYPIYTTYLDLESYVKEHFEGVGICIANLADDMQEYMRGLFIGTYIAPLTITAYMYVKAGRELQDHQEAPLAVAMFETRSKDSYSRHGSSASNDITRPMREGKRESESVGSVGATGTVGLSTLSTTYDLYEEELDIPKERRTQKYLIFMVSVYAISLCPLMVLRLAKLAVDETYENTGQFDITFTIFVWIAFVPTISTPGLYASWRMSRSAKERVRGYFRFPNRHLTRVCEDGVRKAKAVGGVARTNHPSTTDITNVLYTHQMTIRTESINGSDDFPENSSKYSPQRELLSSDLPVLPSSTHRVI